MNQINQTQMTRKKTILTYLITITLLCISMYSISINTQAESQATLSITSNQQLSGNYWCWINVSNPLEVGLVEINLTWNAQIVSITDTIYNHAIWDEFIGPGMAPYVNNEKGYICFDTYNFTTGVSTDTWIAKLRFKPTSNSEHQDCTQLTFKNGSMVNMDFQPIPTTTINGTLCIKKTTDEQNPGGSNGGGPILPPSEENQLPIIKASIIPLQQTINANIQFNASQCTDPNGDALTFLWDYGDGNSSTEQITNHQYRKEGTYTVSLEVSDGSTTNTTSFLVQIIEQIANNPPSKPSITGTQNGTKNNQYTYTFESTDADNDLIQYHIDWDDGSTNVSEFTTSGNKIQFSHHWNSAGKYVIVARSFDNKTYSESQSLVLLIDAVQILPTGYIMDIEGDGIYDVFHNESTDEESNLKQMEDGWICIDKDCDTTYDILFNPATAVQEPFTTVQDDNAQNPLPIVLIGIAIILIVIIGGIYWKKTKK